MLIKLPPVNTYLVAVHEKSHCGTATAMGEKWNLLDVEA